MAPAPNELSGQHASAGLHAPAESGQVVFSFPPGDLQAAVRHNRQRLASGHPPQVDGLCLQELSRLGRAELFALAIDWTSRYRELPPEPNAQSIDTPPIVLSGHQPTLFHPGGWFKNFILSRLGRQLKSVAINLVIDNDLSGVPSVMTPSVGTHRATWQSVPYDSGSERLPYEFQTLHDPETFASFPARLGTAVRPWIADPLVHRLWPHVLDAARVFPEPGYALAAGRHRLESEMKLQTLEVPLSRLCQTRAFAHFVAEIFSRPEDFATVYNQCLNRFRLRHAIRSESHPLPPLVIENNSVELPFWVYSRQFPIRKRLVVRRTANGIEFQGPDGHPVSFTQKNQAQQIVDLADGPVCLRPRALLTTMFCRLVLSDLFVHGIGGALYDQITDAIAEEFFGWALPPFVTTTGTFRIAGWSPMAAASQLAFLNGQLRRMIYHPERVIADPSESRSLIEAKRQLVAEMDQPHGRRERHHEMTRLNERLREYLADGPKTLAGEIDERRTLLEKNRIVASREISFAAHPETLPSQLADSAASVF